MVVKDVIKSFHSSLMSCTKEISGEKNYDFDEAGDIHIYHVMCSLYSDFGTDGMKGKELGSSGYSV